MRGVHTIRAKAADRGRLPAVIAASLLFHALLLGYLAFQDVEANRRYGARAPTPMTPIFLDIEPRTAWPAAQAPSVTDGSQLPIGARAGWSRPPVSAMSGLVPLSPGAAPAAPKAATAVETTRNLPSLAVGDRVARSLRRTVECASPDLLTPAERSACDQLYAARPGAGVPPSFMGSGDARRDSRFAREGAQALADYERRRRPLSGRGGHFRPDDCGASNLGFNCAGAHLKPEFRRDPDSELNQILGSDRGDPTAPRLPPPPRP